MLISNTRIGENPTALAEAGSHIAHGKGVLVAGALDEPVGGFHDYSALQVNYDAVGFNNANAGRLQVRYDEPTQTLKIVSTNVADNNGVRWLIIE